MDISDEKDSHLPELEVDDSHECDVCERLKEIEKNLRIVLLHLDEARQNQSADKNKITQTIDCVLGVYEKIKKMIR